MGLFGRRSTYGPDVERKIRAAIAAMRPLLRIDTLGVDLVSFEAASGVAFLRIAGDCPDCALSAVELREGIEAHLRRRVPEIREIRTTAPAEREKNG